MTSSGLRTTRDRACLVAAAAAFLAGCASGPLGSRPEITDPSSGGDARDEIAFSFDIQDQDQTRTQLAVKFSVDGGLTWQDATVTSFTGLPGTVVGSSVTGIATTDTPVTCTATWDSYADGVGLAGDTTVMLRLSPSDIDGEGAPVEFALASPVNNNFAALMVDTTAIIFDEGHAGVAGMPPPVVRLGLISNGTSAHGTTLQWTITPDYGADPAWLQFSPAAAGECAVASDVTLTAEVQTAGLTERAAPYVATLAITGVDKASATDAHDPLQYVTVSVVVRNPESNVFVHDGAPSPSEVTSLSFECVAGGADPAPQTFWVENSGETGSTLFWTASDNANVTSPADWLSAAASVPPAELVQGASQEAAAAVTAAGLPAGTYGATITVSGEDTSFTPPEPAAGVKTVDVSLEVQKPAHLGLSATGNVFPYWVNKSGNTYAPESFVVTVTNLGDQPLDWNVTFPAGQPAWVTSVSDTSGTGLAGGATADVTVTVDADAPPPSGLAADPTDYTCLISFNALNGDTNSENFTASVHVYNPATITCTPSTLNFTRLGSSLPPSQSFTITRTGTNVPPVQWSTTTPTPPSETWVWTVPDSGTLTTGSPSIIVNVNSAGLALGSYSATITLNSSETTDPPATVAVNLTVSIDPAGLNATLAATGFDLEFDAARDQIYVSVPTLNSIVTLSASTFAILGTNPVGTQPRGISLGNDGQRLYCALNTAGSVAAWLVGTATVDQIGISALLGDDRTYDVLEVNPDELLVTSNPSSNGFAYVVKVDVDFVGGHASARVANGRIIRARPVLAKSADNTCAYVGAGFSPNSLYKLDMTQPTAPISLEDAHGSVSGTDRLEVSPDFSRIYLRSGQVLRTSDFTQIDSIGSGVPRLNADGSLCYVGTSSQVQVWSTATFLQVGGVPAQYPVNQMLVLPSKGYIAILSGTRVFAVAIP